MKDRKGLETWRWAKNCLFTLKQGLERAVCCESRFCCGWFVERLCDVFSYTPYSIQLSFHFSLLFSQEIINFTILQRQSEYYFLKRQLGGNDKRHCHVCMYTTMSYFR